MFISNAKKINNTYYKAKTEKEIKVIRLLLEIKLLFLVISTVALFFILFTNTKSDPAWSHSSQTKIINNIGGYFGAYFSDLIFYVFGFSAYWFVILLVAYTIKTWREFNIFQFTYQILLTDFFVFRFFGFFLIIFSSTCLECIRGYTFNKYFSMSPGGLLGEYFGNFLQILFGFTGSTIFLLFIFLIGLSLFLCFSWMNTLEKIGQNIEYIFKNIYLITKKILFSGKTNNPFRFKKNIKLKKIQDSLIYNSESRSVHSIKYEKKSNSVEFPPLNLLGNYVKNIERIDSFEEKRNANLIEQKLKEFNIYVKVVATYVGPVVTCYAIEPSPGVKINQIMNLKVDLSRALGQEKIHITKIISGQTCMGIELPNTNRKKVHLIDIFDSDNYKNHQSLLTLALGQDTKGISFIADLEKMPHCLIAGTTGSGKSTNIHAMILSILYKAPASHVRFIMIDPKMLELSLYNDIPHLLCPVVTDIKKAFHTLNWVINEMERRYKLMNLIEARNINDFNKRVAYSRENLSLFEGALNSVVHDADSLCIPFIIVIVDELSNLMMNGGKDMEKLIIYIVQKSRAAGIHLILATQRPSVNIITGLIKANIPARIAFQVRSKIDSFIILDQAGAENLLGMGDMLYVGEESDNIPIRIHGAFVTNDEIHKVTQWLKQKTKKCMYVNELLLSKNDVK